MASGSLKISHNFTGETGYVIAVWKKTTVPLTEVGRQAYPAPHSQTSLLITDLDPVWYFIKFWRSADGVALDQEILTLAGNADTGLIYGVVTYEYRVDRGMGDATPGAVWSDPVSGSVQLRDQRLKDKHYFSLEIRAIGRMSITEYFDVSNPGTDAGGFDLIDGSVWNPDQWIFVTILVPASSGSGSSAGGGGEISDVVVITDDTDFDPSLHGGKLIVVEFSAGIRKLIIPNLATLPNTFFKLQTHGSNKFAGIQLDAGDNVKFLTENKNIIWMGLGEEISIVCKDNILYVVQYNGDGRVVGERKLTDKLELNSLFLDGTQYDQADYPRLMEFVDSLPGTFVVGEGSGVGQWGYSTVINGDTVYHNKGKFSRVDTGTPKIRVPDLRNLSISALKSIVADAADAEMLSINPGGYQHFKTSMKGVVIGLRDGSGGSSTGTIQGTGFSGQDNYNNWFSTPDHIRFNNAAEGFTGEDITRNKSIKLLPIIKI